MKSRTHGKVVLHVVKVAIPWIGCLLFSFWVTGPWWHFALLTLLIAVSALVGHNEGLTKGIDIGKRHPDPDRDLLERARKAELRVCRLIQGQEGSDITLLADMLGIVTQHILPDQCTPEEFETVTRVKQRLDDVIAILEATPERNA